MGRGVHVWVAVNVSTHMLWHVSVYLGVEDYLGDRSLPFSATRSPFVAHSCSLQASWLTYHCLREFFQDDML